MAASRRNKIHLSSLRQERRIDFAFDLAAVHLAKARRIPKLVREVAPFLDLLLVEANVLPNRRDSHQAETQAIRAIFPDQVERIRRIA